MDGFGFGSVGTKERKQRQFDEREQWFLDVAGRLIEEGGLLPLQMNRIAETAEYAVGTLYQHFASKEDLLLALTTAQTREHVELFKRVARWDAVPRERMFAMGVADMIFVHRRPDHFRIAQYALCEVVWRAASSQRRDAFIAATAPVGEVVVGVVEDAVRCGDLVLNGLTPAELSTGLWALSNGTHNLVHVEGVLDQFTIKDAYRLMCRHMQIMLNGFGWKPLADPGDDAATDRLIQRIKDEVFHDLCNQA